MDLLSYWLPDLKVILIYLPYSLVLGGLAVACLVRLRNRPLIAALGALGFGGTALLAIFRQLTWMPMVDVFYGGMLQLYIPPHLGLLGWNLLLDLVGAGLVLCVLAAALMGRGEELR